jgi:hypothetical protein
MMLVLALAGQQGSSMAEVLEEAQNAAEQGQWEPNRGNGALNQMLGNMAARAEMGQASEAERRVLEKVREWLADWRRQEAGYLQMRRIQETLQGWLADLREEARIGRLNLQQEQQVNQLRTIAEFWEKVIQVMARELERDEGCREEAAYLQRCERDRVAPRRLEDAHQGTLREIVRRMWGLIRQRGGFEEWHERLFPPQRDRNGRMVPYPGHDHEVWRMLAEMREPASAESGAGPRRP